MDEKKDEEKPDTGLVNRVLQYFHKPSFSWNALAPSFFPGSTPGANPEVFVDFGVPEQRCSAEDAEQKELQRPQFSKIQVNEMINRTTQEASKHFDKRFDDVCARYENIIADPRSKLAQAEAALCAAGHLANQQHNQVAEQQLEQEQKPEHEQLEEQLERNATVALHLTPGDDVVLAGLKAEELNGAHGDVFEHLASGRLRIKLDWWHRCKTVAMRIENVKLTSSAADIAAVKKLRDEGLSVSCLLKRGFALSTIHWDDNDALCNECCRPRSMCSCLLGP